MVANRSSRSGSETCHAKGPAPDRRQYVARVWPLMLFVLWPRSVGPTGSRGSSLAAGALGDPAAEPVWVATQYGRIAQSLQPGLAAAGWIAGASCLAGAPWAIGSSRRPVRLQLEDATPELAGGRFALVFGLSIFAVRYALGVLFGIVPALRAVPFWICLPRAASAGSWPASASAGWRACCCAPATRPFRGPYHAPILLLVPALTASIAEKPRRKALRLQGARGHVRGPRRRHGSPRSRPGS